MHRPLQTCILLAFLLLPRLASAASPYDVADSEELFDKGVALRDEGKYAEARAAFQESNTLDPSAGALLNIAFCEEHLGLLATALEHFRALAPRVADNPARADLVATFILALEPRVPKLLLTLDGSAPPKTTVLLDGAAVDPARLGDALEVDPGTHAIVVRAPDRPDRRYELVAKEGVTTPLQVDAGQPLTPSALPVGAAVAPAANEAPSPAPKTEPSHGPALALLGIGAVGFVVGGALVGVSGSDASRADKLRTDITSDGGVCVTGKPGYDAVRCVEAQGARAAAAGLGTAGSVSLVVGGVATVAGLAILLWPEAKRPSGSGVTIRAAPSASITEKGILVWGSF